MTDKFALDPRLLDDGYHVLDLTLCRIILVNNSLLPWIILVPMILNVREIIDLKTADQATLMQEISLASKVMKELFSPYKLNIATLGNKVEQLHIHIIARYQNDFAWPEPPFVKEKPQYKPEQIKQNLLLLRKKFNTNPVKNI